MRKKSFVPCVLVLSALILLNQTAKAEPVVSERYENYMIQGKTREDLLAAMNKHASKFAGREYYGSTDWQIKWGYHNESDDTQCRVTSFQVSADIVIHMPVWTDFSSASPKLQHDWVQFVKALLEHEKGHARIGRQGAYEVEKILKKIKTFKTCEKIDQTLNNAVNKKIEDYKKKDRDYDEKTNHGLGRGLGG